MCIDLCFDYILKPNFSRIKSQINMTGLRHEGCLCMLRTSWAHSGEVVTSGQGLVFSSAKVMQRMHGLSVQDRALGGQCVSEGLEI